MNLQFFGLFLPKYIIFQNHRLLSMKESLDTSKKDEMLKIFALKHCMILFTSRKVNLTLSVANWVVKQFLNTINTKNQVLVIIISFFEQVHEENIHK